MDDSEFSDQPLVFPMEGLGLDRAFVRQTGQTTPEGDNVRAFDTLEDRKRGGSRSGLAKWMPNAMPGEIQGLGTVAATGQQFVIGFFPFAWPDFVLDPVNFGPVRFGGSGYPSLASVVPTLAWSPSSHELFEDEAFAGGHYDATATNPIDSTPLAGTFSYDPPLGTVFGHTDQRDVIVTFTPTDSADFRQAQATQTFKRKQTPTKVVWAPPATEAAGFVIDGTLLNATGANLATSAAVPGVVVYAITYFDEVVGHDEDAFAGDTMLAGKTYTFRALFKPTDDKRFKASRQKATITVGAAPAGPYTFRATDVFYSGVELGGVTSLAVKVYSGVTQVDSFFWSTIDLVKYEALIAAGNDGGHPAPGPFVVTVGDDSQIDGGGQATWMYL